MRPWVTFVSVRKGCRVRSPVGFLLSYRASCFLADMIFLKSHNSVTIFTEPYKGELLYTMIWSCGARLNPHIPDIDYKIPLEHKIWWWTPYVLKNVELRYWHKDMWKVYRDGEFLQSIYDAHIWEPVEAGHYDEILYNPKMAQKFWEPTLHLDVYERHPKFPPHILGKGHLLPNTTTDSLIYTEKHHMGREIAHNSDERLSIHTVGKFLPTIVQRILSGESVSKIGADYGVDGSRIGRINSGHVYKKQVLALGYDTFPLRATKR